MSRSCQSATFSSAGVTAERTMRARPVRFSVSTGLRLCGMADEPFCPSEKNSSASSTSVRCRWRISVASRSTEEATTPSVAKKAACRSRGITWVETGSGSRPSFFATNASTRGSMLAKVPTAPEMAQVEISSRADDQTLSGARKFRVGQRELHAEGRGLGVDAVRAADGRRELVLEGPALDRGEQRRRRRRSGCRKRAATAPRGRCRARPNWSCPDGRSARRRR